jgi:hypothetical protein
MTSLLRHGDQPSLTPGHLPWGFRPFDVVSSRSPPDPGLPSRYVPLAGFLNLLAAYSSSNLVGLFHPTNARGILSFRAFSSSRAVTPYRGPVPSCRCLPAVTPGPRLPGGGGAHTLVLGRACETWRPASGPFSRDELVRDPPDVTPRGRPMLSWTCSSLRSSLPAAMARPSPSLLSCFSRQTSP